MGGEGVRRGLAPALADPRQQPEDENEAAIPRRPEL